MNLLLAAMLLMQDKTAEEAYKKLEESIYSAKTLRVKYKGEGTTTTKEGSQKTETSGLILIKEGNKLYASDETTLFGVQPKLSTLIASDGSKMEARAMVGGLTAVSGKTPAYLGKAVLWALFRVGPQSAVGVASGALAGMAQEDMDSDKTRVLSGLTLLEDGEKSRAFSYQLKFVRDPAIVVNCKLWYTQATLVPLRRSTTMKAEGIETTYTETYDQFTLNTDIPDEKFRLPEEKK